MTRAKAARKLWLKFSSENMRARVCAATRTKRSSSNARARASADLVSDTCGNGGKYDEKIDSMLAAYSSGVAAKNPVACPAQNVSTYGVNDSSEKRSVTATSRCRHVNKAYHLGPRQCLVSARRNCALEARIPRPALRRKRCRNARSTWCARKSVHFPDKRQAFSSRH